MKDMYELDLRQVVKIQTALLMAASNEEVAATRFGEAASRFSAEGQNEQAQRAAEASQNAFDRAAEYRELIEIFN